MSEVTYEAFGAVGDGVTDDLAAISEAHAYANTHDLPVRVVHGGHFASFDGARYRALIREYLDAKGG